MMMMMMSETLMQLIVLKKQLRMMMALLLPDRKKCLKAKWVKSCSQRLICWVCLHVDTVDVCSHRLWTCWPYVYLFFTTLHSLKINMERHNGGVGRSFSFLNGWFVCSMLIFQGVCVPVSLTKKATAPLPYSALPHPQRFSPGPLQQGRDGREQLTRVETCGLERRDGAILKHLGGNPKIGVGNPQNGWWK